MGSEQPEWGDLQVVAWRIFEAFQHDRLGAILVCSVTVIDRGVVLPGMVRYLQSPCDGDPVYLEALAGSLAQHWTADNDYPRFSAN